MATEIPTPTSAYELHTWSDEVDVLVVGAGMGGASAALEAAAAGSRVLVIDRGGRLTCTTAMAGGHFYLGGGTPLQEAAGFDDSPEEMAKYLRAMSPECAPEKIEAYCEGSVEHFHWLESLGFSFERSYYPGKAVVQPATEGLMYTGNEKCWPFNQYAEPAPRGHKPPIAGDTGGAAFVLDLALARLDDLGVEVRYDTAATGLVVGSDGDVTGVTWKSFGQSGAIRARAVVLAAGGFVLNSEMVSAYAPRLTALMSKGMPLGNSYDDGLGIRLGESVGGVAEHMDGAFFTSPFYPPEELLKGIVVNKHGERFVNEDSYHGRVASFVFDQPDQIAYLILDSETMDRPHYGFQSLVDGWETLEEMEEGLGIPAGALARTMADYNASAGSGVDPAFGKAAEFVVPLDTPPYGAYDLTPGKAFYSGFTMGGLRVTVDGQLLSTDGSTIPGAYAVGACASNIAYDGAGYSSGTQLGEASFFGRRAGRHAAKAAAATVV
ncbi:FAD-binding protein [Haloechinothrix sp. YIM 98757]|uniref:FAD-binding protein n=1 Tax=Haloechinothrix aidingensis TaxID=2752311 RepID=A0A838ACJ3_9PSEU|nr:FAD-binding protein [Haloechinothrix aidingensis]MBA0126943.1 FAD-binding protein [Haloechinothrix aidingensis]